jgi:MOSC domain-containing protein YiiM
LSDYDVRVSGWLVSGWLVSGWGWPVRRLEHEAVGAWGGWGMSSYVSHVNISEGGVPKLPIAQAKLTLDGLEGDRQKDLRYHGGRDRAVCLWSADVIAMLQAEGHPIEPGSTGENLTIAGLDWGLLQVGSRLLVGEAVLLEITDYAAPCGTIARYFMGRKYGRISQKKYPGLSRLYARVLRDGAIAVGDSCALQSDPV